MNPDSLTAFHIEQQTLQSLALSPSQTLVAVACQNHVRVIKISSSKSSTFSYFHKTHLELKKKGNFTINDLAWSADQKLIAISTTNGVLGIFNVIEGRHIWEGGESGPSINKISWHPLEGNILASTSQDGTVKIWNTNTKKCVTSFSYHDPCKDVSFDCLNPNRLAAVYENGQLNIWDWRKEKPLMKISAHRETGLSVAWHPTAAHTLATGSRDKVCIQLFTYSL